MSSFRSPLHSHILSLRNFSQYFQTPLRKDPSDREEVILKCRFCEVDLDGSTSIYCCEKCCFYIHASCATPPRQIQHPGHEHNLDLQGPDKKSKSFYYQCVEFDCRPGFKLDAGMAMNILRTDRHYRSMLREAGDGESQPQFADEHPLTSFPARSSIFCSACCKQISEEAYGCGKCNFFLHEACANAPVKIQSHPFHVKHPLYLFYDSSQIRICHSCGSWHVIGYRCEECQLISFDPSCVISTMPCEDDDEREDIRRRLSGMDHSLHRHQLSSYHSKTLTGIKCRSCGGDIPSGDFLGCSDCGFFIHESCVQPPLEITHYLHPEHTLNFAQCPDEERHYCSFCKVNFDTCDSYCYTCEKCDYFIHLSCAPAALSLLQKGESMTVQCSFHEHELNLYYSDNESGNCIVCEGSINRNSLAYKCISQECSFKIHKSCAQPPSKLEHPAHSQHPLTLGIKPPNEDIECRCCDKGIGGLFAFSCGECNFYLHVACAQKPTLKHPFHEHNLFHFAYLERESRPNNFECGACLKRCNYDFLWCAQCDFTLHYDCSQLPSTIKSEHYWEPLVLHDSYIEDDSGEYYCDICEKRRDPNKWVYRSETGNYQLIAHVECALSPVKLEVIEEDETIRRKEDIQRQEEQIRLAQEQVDAKEVSLRPLMVELESMRAKLDSQMADLEEMKTQLAKWINEEATEEDEYIRGGEDVNATGGESGRTDGEQQNNATEMVACRQQ